MASSLTRRALIRAGSSLALIGAAGMVTSQCVPTEAPAAATVPQSAELHRLIEASRSAERAWLDAFDRAEDAFGTVEHDAAEAEVHRLGALTTPALRALLVYRVSNLDELRIMLAYLREPDGPWDDGARIDGDDAALLLDSILDGRA